MSGNHSAKILIVDDQEANLLVLEKLLKKEGYEALRCLNDSRQTVSTVQEFQPDLLLLDLMMPHMDGFAVIEALKPLLPEGDYFPILVLTADVSAEVKRRALAAGAMDFLTKPFDAAEVLLRVRNLLHTRALHRELRNQSIRLEEKVRQRTAELNERVEDLELIRALNAAVNAGKSIQEVIALLSAELRRLFGCKATFTALADPQEEFLILHSVDFSENLSESIEKLIGASLATQHFRIPITGDGLYASILQEGKPVIINDAQTIQALMAECTESRALKALVPPAYHMLGIHSAIVIPLLTSANVIGLLYLARAKAFPEADLARVEQIAGQLTNAIARRRVEEETQRRLRHIEALRAIDQAIAGSVSLEVTLSIALQETLSCLKVDAAAVLLLDPLTQTLTYAAGRGFRSKAIERARLHLGEGHAGRAALERRLVSVPNMPEEIKRFVRADLLAGEEFECYHAAPLIAKGQVKGVLEVFLRQHRPLDNEWLKFFEMLAGQIAIAVDNAGLFDGLQRANLNLVLAYDATIEGWSRAMDLRDKETEGHTQRVTEMTLALARAMGVRDEQLVHIRRGALLHDMGKLGVPDAILLKPGKLTDEEWVIMRQHPQFAFDMLHAVEYLRPALDIPYAHHEKWDGSGYPRGLKGEQIPLAARLFAVVDIYDALTSDRPYRSAWSREKTLEYIRSLSGSHLDPAVVEAFLKMVL